MSYDAKTGQYVIIRTGTFSNRDGTDPTFVRKRLTVVCLSYQWGEHEVVRGPNACSLSVGRLYKMNMKPGPDLLITLEDPGNVYTFSIAEGDGDNRVIQLFSVLKYEVLP